MLNGKRILVVEDDHHLADQLCQALRQQGAVVLGPAPTPYYAMHLLGRRGVDIAILDDFLHGIPVFALADELTRRGIPVLFTGTAETFPPRFQDEPRLQKPYDQNQLLTRIAELVSESRPQPATAREFEQELIRLDDGEVTSRTRMLRALASSLRQTARRHADELDLANGAESRPLSSV